jgi:hypothetical protein
MEAIDAGQVHKNRNGERYGDKVAEVPDAPYHPGGQARHDGRSPHRITSPGAICGFFPA